MVHKRCKKLLACLIAMALIPVAAFADDVIVTVEPPVFDTVSGQPEAGALHTELPVTVSGTGNTEILFATAVYQNSTGELAAVAVDYQTLQAPGGRLETDMQITSLEGCTFRYFVWDGQLQPIAAAKPEVIDLQAPFTGIDSVSLDWEPNAANAQYIIRRDGKEVGRTSAGRYIDVGLEQNTEYTYTVQAVASDGVTVSEPETVTARTDILPYAVMTDPVVENKLAFTTKPNTDSYTLATVQGGRECRETSPWPLENPTRTTYAYYTVQRNLIPSEERNVTFEVTYFDNSTDPISIGYNQIDDSTGTTIVAKDIELVKRTNTNTWKTARVSVTDANFRQDPALQGGNDFRIGGSGAKVEGQEVQFNPVYIARVAVAPTADFPEETAYIDWQGGLAEYDNITDAGAGLFTIEDSFLVDSAYDPNPQAYHHLELTADYADASKTVQMTYQSTSGEQKTVPLPKDGKLELTDITCNGAVEGVDFKLTVDNGELADALGRLTVRKAIPQAARASMRGEVFAFDGLTVQVRELKDEADGYHEAATIGGRDCRSIVSDQDAQRPYRTNNYLYCCVDDRYAYGAKDAVVALTISYFDQGGGSIELQYNTEGNAFSGIKLADLTDTGVWKESTVTLTNACFTNAQNPPVAADFRIGVGGMDNTIYISDITLEVVGRRTPEPEEEQSTMIFLAGDSTCENYVVPDYGFGTDNPREGWGVEIGGFFDESVIIRNQAKGGKSTRTYWMNLDASGGQVREEGFSRLGQIASEAMPGDYLFIQFGHNDLANGTDAASQAKHTDPSAEYVEGEGQEYTSYRENLRRFAAFAEENGMQPVFLTSICERRFDGDDKLLIGEGALEEYRQATREVGIELGVPVIDVAKAHEEFLNTLGETGSETYFAVTGDGAPDRTHITKQGALKICEIIAEGIREGAAEDTPAGNALKPLAALLKQVQP